MDTRKNRGVAPEFKERRKEREGTKSKVIYYVRLFGREKGRTIRLREREREADRELGIKHKEKLFLFNDFKAVIQDERALTCT